MAMPGVRIARWQILVLVLRIRMNVLIDQNDRNIVAVETLFDQRVQGCNQMSSQAIIQTIDIEQPHPGSEEHGQAKRKQYCREDGPTPVAQPGTDRGTFSGASRRLAPFCFRLLNCSSAHTTPEPDEVIVRQAYS